MRLDAYGDGTEELVNLVNVFDAALSGRPVRGKACERGWFDCFRRAPRPRRGALCCCAGGNRLLEILPLQGLLVFDTFPRRGFGS